MIFLKSKRKNGISEIVSEQIFHIQLYWILSTIELKNLLNQNDEISF